jgi:general secretion pathway protein C
MQLKLDIGQATHTGPAPSASSRNVSMTKAVLWGLFAAWTGWLAYGWLRDLAPRDVPPRYVTPRAAIDVASATDQAAVANLFGKPATSIVIPEAVALDIKLKGVFASAGALSGAIVNTGGKDQFVEVGKEIRPGVVLRAVHAGYIVVNRDGTAQRVELGQLQSSGASPLSGRGGTAREERIPDSPSPPPQPAPPAFPPANAPLPETPLPEGAPPTAPPAAVSQAPGYEVPNTVDG